MSARAWFFGLSLGALSWIFLAAVGYLLAGVL